MNASPTDFIIFFTILAFGASISCSLQIDPDSFQRTECSRVADQFFSNSSITLGDQLSVKVSDIAAGGVAGLLLVTVFFPNPFTIFAGLFLFLLTLAVLPSNVLAIFTQYLPSPFPQLIGGLIAALYIAAGVTWYKGGGNPL